MFYNVPGSEAPAELTFSIPSLKLYNGAEILSHTMHNLYTLRGAKVRDALKWVGYLDQAMQHAKASDVLIAQHHVLSGAMTIFKILLKPSEMFISSRMIRR